MDEHRKNPYRRPAKPGEQRPGLRQLPKDFDDLATGKTERLPRPRRPPAPLHDEREGAVIPGVRNTEARAVYDARVQALRALLGDELRESELHAGLEETRKLRLWRARNVTDYRAFIESVVGVEPSTAQQLAEIEQHAASEVPDHVVALALRLEAALLAHSRGASVRVAQTEGGELRIGLELSVADIGHAVEALEDAGRAVSGLRRYLTDAERPPERDSARPNAYGEPRERDRERGPGSARDRDRPAPRGDARYGREQLDRQPNQQRGDAFPRRDRAPFPSRGEPSRDDRGPRHFGKKPEKFGPKGGRTFDPKGRPRKPGNR
jgi:hypothetical protein